MRARGGIVVVIAHRPSALAGVDQVLVMAEGRMQSFGPKDEVLSKVLRPAAVPASRRLPAVTPLKVVEDLGAALMSQIDNVTDRPPLDPPPYGGRPRRRRASWSAAWAAGRS